MQQEARIQLHIAELRAAEAEAQRAEGMTAGEEGVSLPPGVEPLQAQYLHQPHNTLATSYVESGEPGSLVFI